MSSERLDRRMRDLFPELSWTRVRDAIASGQVRVDDELARDPARLIDDTAHIVFDPSARRLAHARLDLPILHEDETILVIDKPAGLLTIASRAGTGRHEDTVLSRVTRYATRLQGRRAYAGVLHRLDRDTSGALALALSRETHTQGRALFSTHAFERWYLALVHGLPYPREGTIDVAVSNRYVGGRRRLVSSDAEGRSAVTHYHVRETFAGGALVELRLETGRQHQIRLHMERLGHPLIGERVYVGARRAGGSGGAGRVSRQMLHAWRLAFPHPLTGEMIRVEAPMPDDFQRTMHTLRSR